MSIQDFQGPAGRIYQHGLMNDGQQSERQIHARDENQSGKRAKIEEEGFEHVSFL